MAITLTPDQQAKLEKFEEDAVAAVKARQDAINSASELLEVTARSAHDKQTAIEELNLALASAKEFIDAMLPKGPDVSPSPTGAKPK